MRLQAVLQAVWVVVLAREASSGMSTSAKICGRELSNIMSKICTSFNSPDWAVENQSRSRVKREEQGIADECCNVGCTWFQLIEYCADEPRPDPATLYAHLIEDRSADYPSAEDDTAASSLPSSDRSDPRQSTLVRRLRGGTGAGSETRGYGRRRGRGRRMHGRGGRRRCSCRRRHPSRSAPRKGNTATLNSSSRNVPVIGTVSPLLRVGHFLNSRVPYAVYLN